MNDNKLHNDTLMRNQYKSWESIFLHNGTDLTFLGGAELTLK